MRKNKNIQNRCSEGEKEFVILKKKNKRVNGEVVGPGKGLSAGLVL
jgi:hypothetical protein